MFQELEQKVVDYCKQYSLFPEKQGSKVLVALSGGGDSVALLSILLRIRDIFGITIEAAHLNHSLRGKESIEDENYTRKLCTDLGIHLTIERLREGNISGNERSIETEAREIRMAFLKRAATDRDAARIATGHTMDDQTETVLHRILRGTGPSGLAGILPIRDNLWIRPLLGVTRNELREYLEGIGVTFREDTTNQDTVFFRNRIRHELIPFIREHFSPGVTGVVARLAELSRIQEYYLEEKMIEAYRCCCMFENSYKILLDKRKFMDYHKVVKQRVVRKCLELLEGEGRDTDLEEVKNVLCLLDHDRGTVDVTSSIQCGVGRLTAAFVRRAVPFVPIPLELYGETVIPQGGGRIIAEKTSSKTKVDGRMTVLVNSHITGKYGILSVGPVRRGEFMVPFGMSEAVKISELISASLLPKVLRSTIPVIRAGAVPIWIPGLRSSEYLRILEGDDDFLLNEDTLLLTFKDVIYQV